MEYSEIEDPKKKKPLKPVKGQSKTNLSGVLSEDPIDAEMKVLYKRNMNYDNKSAKDIVRSAAQKTGVSPSLLFSSAFQEGMNKAIARPDEVSEAYNMAVDRGLDTKNYPVDGFYNYGIDKFSDYLPRIQADLPQGFEQRYKTYPAKNEKGETINTVAFRTNEDAMIAKSAILKDAMREVDGYAKTKGVALDDNAKNYFTLARYNSSPENYKIMIDEYAKAKDKKAFIEKGETSRKGVHKNISPRLKRMKLADELLKEEMPVASSATLSKLRGVIAGIPQ